MTTLTLTASESDGPQEQVSLGGLTSSQLPTTLSPDLLAKFPKLSREQAGHLRHFHNLATQKDGEWRHMGSQEPGQEWLDAYRYQLATMAYAAGAAHYHRLPVLRSAFKALLEAIIHKMLLRDVWGYWFLTSHSGVLVDPDIKELRKPWADPVARENIMYSGHLLHVVSLYKMLFNDDKFDQEDSIAFHWNPVFWGMGPEKFSYTRKSLQEAIFRDMEREKWMGVCCEPNSIFVICNQFPLIGLRYNDVQDKVNESPEVLRKYQEAWAAKGMVQDNGLVVEWYSPKQDRKVPAADMANTAWALAFMNSWNPDFTRRMSKRLAVGYLAKPAEGDRVIIPHPSVSFKMRELVESENLDPKHPATFIKAAEIVASEPAAPEFFPYTRPQYAYALMWLSELGDGADLEGMLAYVDDAFAPTWENGGLFYPCRRSDSPYDYKTPTVDVLTGNAGVAYGRLNVPDGQRKMYEAPWDEEHFATTPFVSNVDLSSGVDFLRGSWDGDAKAFVVTMRSWDGATKRIQPQVSGLKTGLYGLYLNGRLDKTLRVTGRDDKVDFELEVPGDELDVVLLKSS
ncbi:Linalool dehydratase/isomerase [Colletotrichum sidae]|uniref:Linalool dehydratase/isomerase n=1 Tax=Colletotrichum sidae TaxID=1347389 RepID=A0A4R8TBY2_9PEZI|nr:Linalool dehydratase/isomerase [Colletotrichum sidae]